MDKKVIQIISRFRHVLEASGTKIDKLILFGSYAKNQQHVGSDIDLAVISKNFRRKSYWKRTNILSRAIYEVFEPIEAIAFTPEEWKKNQTMMTSIVREGKSIELSDGKENTISRTLSRF
jgi:predicted nucleotidyltransferase